jgi:hypothetical protein
VDPTLPEARQTVLGVGRSLSSRKFGILSHESVFSGLSASFCCQISINISNASARHELNFPG